jgi:excisionase family DNA binding protein
MSADRLLSPGEMGERLGVTGKTVLEWFHEGRIPAAVATGRIYRFDAGKVEAALARDARKACRAERCGRLDEAGMVPVL